MKTGFYKAKRLFDLIFSIIILVLSIPLILIIALIIRFNFGPPVLFKQRRPGYKGKIFTLIKFRTMSEERDEFNNLLHDTKRITFLGKLLRATSLDELPELWNVIRGDMSVVGPRPLLQEYLPLYSKEQARRHDVKPGITGWAQVNGRNAISWKDKFNLDVWYVDNCSFFLDLIILLRTLITIATMKGINQADRATVDRFNGNN